jgi:hypothetical protein
MSRWFKFAAVLLVMTLGGIPLLAGAPCSHNSEPGIQCCPPGCAMMARGEAIPPTQVESRNPASSCCDFHSGRPIHTAELQTPSATASIALPLSTIAFVITTKFGADDELLFRLPNPGSHQALLCTFLI